MARTNVSNSQGNFLLAIAMERIYGMKAKDSIKAFLPILQKLVVLGTVYASALTIQNNQFSM
ncbi:MAG: hypothetical protein C5B47_05280 [Verrucomicrobia bacterium]|nr:MAG: hypothetical protein C5B47_05280 [Verrucomicrobiota bacterium]